MILAKVIGNIWATRKQEKLNGIALLVVKPIDIFDENKLIQPIIAADKVGAGMGETVLLVSGSAARNALGDSEIPVDATIVGIVDGKDVDTGIM